MPWDQHLPLREELEIICSKFPSAIILIDDFRVDDDSTYHFDDYGNGNTVATSYLETANTPALYQFSQQRAVARKQACGAAARY